MTQWKYKVPGSILFTLSTILFLTSGLYWFSIFLTKQDPHQTNHYLIEGRSGPYEMERSVRLLQSREDAQLYIVGKKFDTMPPDPAEKMYFWRFDSALLLLTNASAFISSDLLPVFPVDSVITVSCEVTGSGVDDIYAHFTIVVNGEKAGTFFTTDSKQVYQLKWPTEVPVSSVGIYYDNDLATKKEGRYLVIHGVTVSTHRFIPGPHNTYVTFDRTKPATGYTSEAEQMAAYFIDLGLEKDQIHIVDYNPGTINQTLSGARAFRAWVNYKAVPDLNILSSGYHSRRSWLTYKRILSPEIQVGIVTLPSHPAENKTFARKRQSLIHLVDESLSYVGNWFYFTFTDP